MEPECGINCISETLSEAKQDDIYCKLDAACLALVTACCVLWNVDFQSWDLSGTWRSSSLGQEQARTFGVMVGVGGSGGALQDHTWPGRLLEADLGETAILGFRPHSRRHRNFSQTLLKKKKKSRFNSHTVQFTH